MSATPALEWTTFDRRGPRLSADEQTRQREENAADYWRVRHDVEARMQTPDVSVFGCVVPYDVVLIHPRVGRLRFSSDTEWDCDPTWVELRAMHATPVGHVSVFETAEGLRVEGKVHSGGLRRFARGKGELSSGLVALYARERHGVHEVMAATLSEVSLVDHGQFAPFTKAMVVPAL